MSAPKNAVDREAIAREIEASLRDGRCALDRSTRSAALSGAAVSDGVAAYVEKVRHHAYRVEDADIDALRAAGLDDDRIFELTVSTAFGASLRRLDAGLRALRGKGRRT